jgi:hypothetical protein
VDYHPSHSSTQAMLSVLAAIRARISKWKSLSFIATRGNRPEHSHSRKSVPKRN